LEILSFKTLPSTQKYLQQEIQNKTLVAPVAVIAQEQSDGVGSRDNRWIGGKGDFFASIAVKLSELPKDLPLASASIYFSYIMKQTLVEFDEKIWLKWPNDFYINDEKVGGTITKKVDDTLVCGIGINLKKSQNGYSALQSDILPNVLLKRYLLAVETYPKWKHIFSHYKIEFELSRKFSVHIENYQKEQKISAKQSLADASLQDDGSLIIDNKKVFSLR
jgi:BirA family biotin operon repressor/biotin-[acetyl-CoA-carboxylase] ligase